MLRGGKTLGKYTHIVAIDEVGRGPLAGPVAVGAVMLEATIDVQAVFPGVRDSKVMTPEKREAIFGLAREREVRYAVEYESAEEIDRGGITGAIRKALAACMKKLAPDPATSFVYLDGLLYAPAEYQQETVVHGDALIPAISLASVIAKVSRDAHMHELALRYPVYGFDRHKGYGTREHIEALKAHGPSPEHRRSFLSRILLGAVR